MYDTCNCEKSEDCMCAAASAYVYACSAAGVLITGWRDVMCDKFSTSCTPGTVYEYRMTSCGRTCYALSQMDYTCDSSFPSIDGCGCSMGTYMNDNGRCVPSASCPCYDGENIIPSGQVINKDGGTCFCREARLSCEGVQTQVTPSCKEPMVYFNCSDVTPGSSGVECQKSCGTLDMACMSTGCTSGCMCPDGLIADGLGGCISESSCPCVHNGKVYQPGETLTVDCNTCSCRNRKFTCTKNVCDAVCGIYGDGHYITFDGKRFEFSGECEYSLAQDYCGSDSGSVRIITENVLCGTTGTTCSKTIKIYLESDEYLLKDEILQVVKGSSPSQVSKMGIYLVVAIKPGLVVMWDKKTSLFIKLGTQYQGKVCGLCGNYDGNSKNDFTTRSQETVADVLEFGNSWKVSSGCPDAKLSTDPCTSNRYRAAWSQRQCSIITSVTFQDCHSKVDPGPYYDSCVRDSCACDTGGDCECFCTAVAAYAKSCNEAGACVKWRTPKRCPVFCDYYNSPDGCEWHYKPCGADCMKTCRNPSGNCSALITGLEGCYPQCPPAQPFFNEDSMTCVAWEQCGCYDDQGTNYGIGDYVPSENCYSCSCKLSGISCVYDVNYCSCFVNGKTYKYGETIYNTTDGVPVITTAGPTTAVVTSTPSVVTGTTKVPEITPITTPTLCICNVNGTIYRPGDTVYNVTDGLGWCYIAFCNASCKTDKRFNPCVTPSTTIPATTTVFIGTTPPPTPPPTIPPQFTTPPFTTALDCVHLDPPRKNGETWRTENCTTATCVEGSVEETATICATPRPVVCANGREPVMVSEDGCCYEKQCECICSTWSKKHYRTFDGFKYDFKGQCSYYLVKEIVNKHAFNITVSNADCRTEDKKFCPQSLIITYGDYKIYLTHKINSFSVITNEVYINQKRIYPAFSNSVVRITNSDRVVKVMIPDIKTEIVFSPTLVLISLNYQIFSGKTEGLCGELM
ncbi:mucin-5B-like [Synchiropus picturatus]